MNAQAIEVPLCIEPTHPALPGHFPGRPLVPGVVLLDAVLQSVQRPLGGAQNWMLEVVKFHRPALPGEPLRLQLRPGTEGSVHFAVRRDADLLVSGVLRLPPAAAGLHDGD